MTLVFHLKFAGVLLIFLAFAHAGFDRQLKWKSDILKLTLPNRQIFLVHWFFIALFLLLFGALSLLFARSLLRPDPLSRAILLGMTIVWALRLYAQWFVFDRSLWKNDRVNKAIHYTLSGFWMYLVIVYADAMIKVSS